MRSLVLSAQYCVFPSRLAGEFYNKHIRDKEVVG